MQFRIVTGEEREWLIGTRKTAAFDYGPYLEAIHAADDGDVIGVELNGKSQRGEKIRFSRAARLANKSLRWLVNPSENEIAFTITSDVPTTRRGRPRKQREQRHEPGDVSDISTGRDIEGDVIWRRTQSTRMHQPLPPRASST